MCSGAVGDFAKVFRRLAGSQDQRTRGGADWRCEIGKCRGPRTDTCGSCSAINLHPRRGIHLCSALPEILQHPSALAPLPGCATVRANA